MSLRLRSVRVIEDVGEHVKQLIEGLEIGLILEAGVYVLSSMQV